MKGRAAPDSATANAGRKRLLLRLEQFDTEGYCVIPELLDASQLQQQREALAPWIDGGPKGRNVFEGTSQFMLRS